MSCGRVKAGEIIAFSATACDKDFREGTTSFASEARLSGDDDGEAGKRGGDRDSHLLSQPRNVLESGAPAAGWVSLGRLGRA